MGRVIFITGTDTGVGKTAVTALLLAHAQSEKVQVRALKPFSTGDHGDEAFLAALQDHAFPIKFFHYAEPIAPWAASCLHNQPVKLADAVGRIAPHMNESDLLLVEGAGGLLTPLGERFSLADLIVEFSASVILVAANRLGVLNHTLLTVEALRNRSVRDVRIALVEQAASDRSQKTNPSNLEELIPDFPLSLVPFLPNYMADVEFIRSAARPLGQALTELLADKKNPPDTEAEGTFP